MFVQALGQADWLQSPQAVNRNLHCWDSSQLKTQNMESWRGLLEYWYLGFESLGVSSGVMEATFQGKEIKRGGFEGKARVSWGRPQNTRR